MNAIEVKVPVLPESVADATVLSWHKQVGERVARDEHLVDLETDKVVLEVPAPAEGILTEILQKEGSTVTGQQLLARIHLHLAESGSSQPRQATTAASPGESSEQEMSPTVRRLLAEHDLNVHSITGTGKGGRIVKEDVEAFLKPEKPQGSVVPLKKELPPVVEGARVEKRVPMSRLRARIAERLLEAQHRSAILTTFNEVNLNAITQLRNQYKDIFEKKHGVRLGWMSFFTKAVVEALKRFPMVNASIDGQDIVYHGYYDIGIAISTERGLVVPVLRNVDELNMAGIEEAISNFAERARHNKLEMEDLQGGTFTITNGGVFGSLLATPILNPPQTAILGMHKIEERPIAENGVVVIRPMMYIALSYDHRLIDGKESVQFLATIKALLEDPIRGLLEI